MHHYLKNRRYFIKSITAIASASLLADFNIVCASDQTIPPNPYGLPEQSVKWMREATLQQLQGCRVLGYDGTWLHTPDGIGNYKALFRDLLK